MDKILKLYTYVDGVNDTPFPSAEDPIEIGAFRYDAKRMGGAPIITASVMHPICLDGRWTDTVYAEFNGEKYYLKQTPTSSYDNESVMYKHSLELVSERSILDDVYFFDAVVGNPQGEDKPVSNSTKVVFFGDVREFARRMNASLEYAKLLKWEDGIDEEGNEIKIPKGYHIVVDDDIVTEEKLMSFEDQFFSNVLQEIYNTYEVPYYFEGKTIHIGNSLPLGEDEEIPTFAYGVDDALLSITKNNANQKVVNRMTGTGSEDNIPFYYPNDSPKGEIELFTSGSLTTEDIKILDRDDFTQLHVDKTYSFFGDAEANSESLKAVIPSKGVEVEFADNKATLSKVYIEDGKSVDVHIRFDVSLESDADSKIDLNWQLANYPNPAINMTPPLTTAWGKDHLELEVKRVVVTQGDETYEIPFEAITEKRKYYSEVYYASGHTSTGKETNKLVQTGIKVETPNLHGVASVVIEAKFKTLGNFWSVVPDYFWGEGSKKKPYSDIVFESSIFTVTTGGWQDEDGNSINMKNYGVHFLKDPQYGDSLGYHVVKYINTSQNLMPSVYRATDGAERFYNAINYPFLAQDGYELQYGEYFKKEDKDGNPSDVNYVHNDIYKEADGTYIHFNNPYVEGRPKEHIITDENIKPTIKEAVNSTGLRMDMFSEFAYDLDDNDELIENEDGNEHEYVHSYFFGKLRKLDFNIFDHAIEQQPMTISFTSGDCGACNFEIGVTEEFPQKNPVQVNADGTLKRDEKGRVICGQFEDITEDECQPEQQDTINNEVWIALKKEDTTYGILMPKAVVYEEDGVTIKEAGHRPKACTQGQNDGDTFVILGINLPKPYILNAEKKVEAAIIKGLKENNDEKFTFSITFSRIYFEENPDMLAYLSENSKIAVTYNNETYDLYVSSYSYNMGEGEVLPEIRVELDDTLKVSQNVLQNAINQVKSELGRAVNNIDVVGAVAPYFLRKDVDDEAQGKINFAKGVKFGEGGKVEVLDNNSAKLTIEYLEVTKKATFTSLEIQEKTHVGGQLIISPAAMTCGEVEELSDAYRCYFQTKGADDSDEIFNQFVVGDQAICQTYNSWGSRYYWRLVTGVGEDYIDLSKTECDSDSDIPMSGDKIVQLGNRNDVTRQAAQVLSAHGDDAPSFVMYNGIDSFSLQGKNITGIIWNPETQEPQMYSYGSFFFGDRELAGNYITFQQKEGETNKSLSINANVTIGAGSSGLSNLSEWKEKQEEIDAANTNANTANQNANIAITSANQAKTSAAQALSDANTAIQKAQNAESVANAAAANFESLVSDNTISPVEKQALRNELSNVLADYNDIQKQYQKYIVEFDVLILEDGKYYITEDGFVFNVQTANTNWAEYKAAYTAYKTDLEDKINTEGNVAVGQLMTLQSSYYESRTAILEDISLSIKAEADYSKVMAKSAKTVADDAKAATVTLDAKVENVKTGVAESVAEINARLDGVVENYFEEGAPTLTQKPVTDWIAASEEDDYELINHVGDTYTNIEEYVDDATTPDAGKSWRWCWCEDSSITDKIEVTDKEGVTRYLHWHPIADSDAVKALLEASKAQAAADGKSKTFVTQPVPPYKEGDLWVQGDKGDILRCKKARGENEGFYALDWELASKYTDDAKANEAMDEAAAAKEVAETAKAATDALDNDGLFTVAEKRSIRKALKDINHAEGGMTLPIEWSVTSKETIEGNAWTEITDKSDDDYGWYVSDMHESDGFTIAKISFQVNVKSDVDVYIKSRAEGNYDYTLLSKLDVTLNQSDTHQTTARVADTTRGSQNIERKYTFTDVAVGNHFVTVMYRKDSTTNTQPDNGYFRIASHKFAEGSLGDWMSIVQEKGLDIVICDPAVDAADELFSYLDNTGNVWENVSDEVPEGFRDEVYRLFTAYYKEVSAILVDTATSDLDYLSDAMKKGNTIVNNGLVMTSLVAVGDTENPSTANVGAFMNGSSFAKDTEHGKLMHALGIPLTTEDGDEDLEARSKEAKTMMYEDGTIKSTSLELLNGCKIGKSIRIEDDRIVIDLANNSTRMSLDENGLIVEGYSSATIGNCGGAAVQGFAHGMYAFCPTNTNPIGVQGEAKDGDYAFYSYSGLFAGLRPKTRVITTPKTAEEPNILNAIDFSVLVNATSGTYYIELPTSPLDGQEYVIESRGATIKLTSTKQIWNHYYGKMEYSRDFVGSNSVRFKYYAGANMWTCSWLDWKQS